MFDQRVTNAEAWLLSRNDTRYRDKARTAIRLLGHISKPKGLKGKYWEGTPWGKLFCWYTTFTVISQTAARTWRHVFSRHELWDAVGLCFNGNHRGQQRSGRVQQSMWRQSQLAKAYDGPDGRGSDLRRLRKCYHGDLNSVRIFHTPSNMK